MIIDSNISPFVVSSQDSIRNALKKINDNKSRFVICVDKNGVIEGVLTDGDFRRWVAEQAAVDIESAALSAANLEFETLSVNSDVSVINQKLSKRVLFVDDGGRDHTKGIKFLPLVDDRTRLVAIARPETGAMYIEHHTISDESPAFVIAEIGINHNGSLDKAKELIDLAAASGADSAKFQMRHMESLYRNAGNPDDASADLGSQYTLDILARSLLSDDDMAKAFDYCRERGLIPLCTPWDLASVDVLESYGIPAYKVASADLTNHELLSALAATRKPLIISTGMSTEEEIRESVALLQRFGSSYVLLHCNSTYPAPFKDVNLKYLNRLRDVGNCLVGYSGHERGFSVPLAAVAMGAKVIEKHFTDDREQEGNDHKVSLLPHEFREMVHSIRHVEESMGSGALRLVTQGERMNRENLAKSVIAVNAIDKGAEITPAMLQVRSPGKGLQPNRMQELIGKLAKRDFAPGDFFYPADLSTDTVEPRRYNFRRPYGVPVRYHDFAQLSGLAPLDFVEFHLSYKDMELDLHTFFDGEYDMDVVVHSPDLFTGDHIMNLAEADPVYRQRSVDELQRVIDQSREIKTHFTKSDRLPIVASLGGFSRNAPVAHKDREAMYDLVLDSLSKLDTDGVEILPQTLPPFPWYLGGQLYCNLFVDAEDMVPFAQKSGLKFCFDISHSKLTCNHRKSSFKTFVDQIAPHTAHLHIVDAEGVDGEGVQVGDGEVDFALLAQQLDKFCPDAWFIPEIWQGHKNEGEGFWIAFDRLERWF
ncbi:MAG: TIM barrel protein [Alphaproteobacteria bacterium]|nr:TIM barrel protein [Alphaproteobacteria bacterium]